MSNEIKIPTAQITLLAQLEQRTLELVAEQRDLQNVRHGAVMAVLRAEGVNGFPQYSVDLQTGTITLATEATTKVLEADQESVEDAVAEKTKK